MKNQSSAALESKYQEQVQNLFEENLLQIFSILVRLVSRFKLQEERLFPRSSWGVVRQKGEREARATDITHSAAVLLCHQQHLLVSLSTGLPAQLYAENLPGLMSQLFFEELF